MNNSQLASILLRNSTNEFYINYQGFLFNHMSHGIIALARLGANVERVERFVQWYIPRLEEPGKFRSEENFEKPTELLGKGQNFYFLVDTYKEELGKRNNSLEKLVVDKFPGLFRGLLGAALHGLIHLGYGYSAKSPQVVCEGLAYLHYSYFHIKLSESSALKFAEQDIGKGHCSILEVAKKARNNTELRDFMKKKAQSEELLKLNIGNFSRRAKSLFEFRGDDILEYAFDVHIPTIHQIEQLDVKSQCTALLRWLLETAIAVYALADRDDFFLLHGVTAAWSLLQVAPDAVGHSKQLTQEVVKTLVCALITAYLCQDCPTLSVDRLKDGSEKENVWGELIEDALNDDLDEHVYKLVQVCREVAKDSDDENLKKICHVAAVRAINESFVF